MHTDKFPSADRHTGAVHFWFDAGGLPVAAHLTRRGLIKLGCKTESAHEAISVYFRHKRVVDGVARAKRLAACPTVVDAEDL